MPTRTGGALGLLRVSGQISPSRIRNAQRHPDESKISTSYCERFNLSVQLHVRRFTRLTNARSKSHAHHAAMIALFTADYNFGRKHETLKGRTPAMAAGLTDHVWTVRELLTKVAGLWSVQDHLGA